MCFPVWAIDQRFQKKIPSSNWTEHCRGAQRVLRKRHTSRKEKKNKDGRSGREGGEGWWGPSKSMVVMVVAWTVSWPQLRGSVVRAFRVTILRLPLFPSLSLLVPSFLPLSHSHPLRSAVRYTGILSVPSSSTAYQRHRILYRTPCLIASSCWLNVNRKQSTTF